MFKWIVPLLMLLLMINYQILMLDYPIMTDDNMESNELKDFERKEAEGKKTEDWKAFLLRPWWMFLIVILLFFLWLCWPVLSTICCCVSICSTLTSLCGHLCICCGGSSKHNTSRSRNLLEEFKRFYCS